MKREDYFRIVKTLAGRYRVQQKYQTYSTPEHEWGMIPKLDSYAELTQAQKTMDKLWQQTLDEYMDEVVL